jgi:hypothetical protein
MTAQAPFAGADRPQEAEGEVTVKVERKESAVSLDVLLHQVAQKRTLAGTGFAKHGNVHGAPDITERQMALRHLFIDDPEAEVEIPPLLPLFSSLPAKAVKDSRDELFEEINHHVLIVEGGSPISVTRGRRHKNPGAGWSGP